MLLYEKIFRDTMKQTNTRKIYVPQLLTDGSDASEEHNARVYNWVKRTGSPTLDEYIINPFETAMKEEVMAQASKTEDLREGAWLRERHTKRWDIGEVSFQAAAYRHSSIAHEVVLGQAQNFLEDCTSDNGNSVHREFLRKSRNGTHVSAGYVLDEIDRWRKANTKFYNKQELQLFEIGTGKNYVPSLDEPVLSVALDTKRFSTINEVNAQHYLRARALGKQLDGFVKDFTQHIQTRHGVDIKEGELEVDYACSDDSAVRYLFFPKETSVQYAKMIDTLSAPAGEKIVASTGDLVILRDLRFGEPYSISGRGMLTVSTEYLKGGLGMCTLDRGEKGKVSYSVFDNKHKGCYVSATGILNRMSELRKSYSSGATQLKVDFFPGAPRGF